ncbi:MAG: hypothetical protein M3N32_05445 [Actinomycetota bacterium]|nr:hypothetical protein [Actinomycetota bacterium]
MSTGPLRLVIAALVLVLLARAAVGAWRNRRLATVVWRTIGLRHLGGALGLFAIVAMVASVLLISPLLRFGLGSLVGFSGNAVFTPLEEIAMRSGRAGVEGGFDWYVAGVGTVFLGFLALLLPWLAFVEEEIFRGGLEGANLREELTMALRFGLVHLIMLVPIAAALAIAVAGFAYGRIYRRTYGSNAHDRIPEVVARTYRPTPRARRAAIRARRREVHMAAAVEDVMVALAPTAGAPPELRQAAGVLASTVWHTTFNSLVLVLLWLAMLLDAATA